MQKRAVARRLQNKRVFKGFKEPARTHVNLYEDPKKVVEIKDVFYSAGLGYFMNDDPRKTFDYQSQNYFIVDPDKKYYKQLYYIYTDIAATGSLTDAQVTLYPPTYSSLIIGNKTGIPELYFHPMLRKYYKEDLNTGKWYKKSIDIPAFVKTPKAKGIDFTYNPIGPKKVKPITYVKTLGKRYTWGVEIETIAGFVPPYLGTIIDVSAVHDGSLRHKDDNVAYGKEYVTGVYKGDDGLKQLKILCNELSRRCSLNYQCGNHFHIGDIEFNKETIVFMYYVYQNIQDEMTKLLPRSRRVSEYCRPITKIDIDPSHLSPTNPDYKYFIEVYYNKIVNFCSGQGGCGRNINKYEDHPKGKKCNWDHSTARYCWVNFVPAVFNTRANGIYTIEFRMPPGTTSYKKNKMWLLLCIALVDVVDNHKMEILQNPNITLEGIVQIAYGTKGQEVIDFIRERKNTFLPVSEAKNKLIEENEYLEMDIDEDLSLRNL